MDVLLESTALRSRLRLQKYSLVANSVKSEIVVEPTLELVE